MCLNESHDDYDDYDDYYDYDGDNDHEHGGFNQNIDTDATDIRWYLYIVITR